MPSSSDSTMSLGCSARNQVPSAIDMELCDAGITTWSKGTSHRASKPLHAVVFTADAACDVVVLGQVARDDQRGQDQQPDARGRDRDQPAHRASGASPARDPWLPARLPRSASSWARERSAMMSSSVTP